MEMTDDLISRQSAIDLIENESRKYGDEYVISDVLCDLADLPSVQAEPKQITLSYQDKSDKFGVKSGKTCADTISRLDTLQLFETAFENNWTVSDTMDALENLPSVRSEPKWILCRERLPEHEQEVLVTRHFLSDNQLKKNAITESFYVEVASWMDDEWTSYSDEYKIKRHLHKVIAWMPLPDPYREEGEVNETD